MRLTFRNPFAILADNKPKAIGPLRDAMRLNWSLEPEPGTSNAFKVAFKLLGLEVNRVVEEQRVRTLLIASAYPGDGKTTVVAGLALALADLGLRVTVLEASRDSRQLLDALTSTDWEPGSTLPSPDHTIVVAPGLTVYPGYALPETHPDPEELSVLLNRLLPTSDIVLIDSPACTISPDAYMMAPAADAVLYLIRKRQQDVVEQRSIIARLKRFGAHLLGAVYNESEKP